MTTTSTGTWWKADKGRVASSLFTYIRGVDRIQFGVFNRFKKLEALYDTTPRPGSGTQMHRMEPRGMGRMHENVVASNVDTVSAQIATVAVRSVFDTDDADWSTQRKARNLELYVEGMGKKLKRGLKCRHAFKAGAVMKGTAVVKVWADRFDRPRLEPVMIDDIVVDELECRWGDPKQLHFRTAVDREQLAAEYPEAKKQIEQAQGGLGQWQTWAGWRPIQRNEVMVIESWRLPIGVKGAPRYVPGRHVIAIDGCDLLDEEWDEEFFPFAIMRWSRPVNGWYGIGMAERIAGIQLALNRRNLQMERKLDHGAYPTTWVHQADAQLAAQQATIVQNAYGTVGVYRGPRPPESVTPPAISPDELQDAERLSSKASQVSGVSRMAAQSVKPPGIETGVALREYRDQTTQRFAEQEQDFEQFNLDCDELLVWVCKKLGPKAPEVVRKSRFGARKIPWSEVDMGEVRVWIGPAATLSRSRAGREQTVVEWAQAGIISQDDARRLLGNHPDLGRTMSLYTAAIENVEDVLDEIADGKTVMPEPYMNLKLLVWRGQQQYLNWWSLGAPEAVLESLRQTIVQAAYWLGQGESANMNVGADPSMAAGAPGAGPAGPGGPAPGGMPPYAAAPPMVTPQAALAPQAMSLAPASYAGTG